MARKQLTIDESTTVVVTTKKEVSLLDLIQKALGKEIAEAEGTTTFEVQ